ncbi:MAG: bi-domain-containing oxidoreductase [Eubacteriales bacterium]|nr:bi-domain-containing oxidoreductase [Eubacteriales bacterium]
MKQLFLNVSDGSMKLIDQPMPTVKENMALVESLYTVVSAGTERGLASFGGKNLVQKALERPDQVKKVLEKLSTDGIVTTLESAFNKLAEPMPMGYSGVGRVVACGRGVTEVQAGDLVAMVGTAYHCEINRVSRTMLTKVPEELTDYRQAAFCALGGIALEGIHQAEVVPGETVAVIGMGLLGHIVSRILNAYGCDVIGYDVADKTMPGTRLRAFLNSGDDNAADMTKSLTRGRGVDKVIITAAADSNAPMDLAAAIARDRGIICMIGVTRMNIDRRPYYERELSFRIARSYGAGRYDATYEQKGIDYPIGYVRFTEGRNIEEFVRLLAQGRLELADMITHEIPFEQAAQAYEMITKNPRHERYIGVLLKYGDGEEKWKGRIENVRAAKTASGDKIRLGLIGAGNFVRSTMLPVMKETGLFEFRGLATTGGVGAAQANDGTPFAYTTNDYRELLADPEIDLIAVSTQHNSHGKFVTEALEAGKSVYCEKPLCLTLQELEEIRAVYERSEGELFVGLNRRHAPLIRQIKKELKTDQVPAVYDFIANAGFIPKDHWVHDEAAGGGRILGEACHFVDLIQYLDGSELTDLHVTAASNSAYPMNDNVLITLRFASGAVGNIVYSSMGSKKYPKEQLRVLSGGSVYEMDNFIRLRKYGSMKTVKEKLRQDKGIRQEYEFICRVLRGQEKNTAIADAFRGQELLIRAMQRVKEHENAGL